MVVPNRSPLLKPMKQLWEMTVEELKLEKARYEILLIDECDHIKCQTLKTRIESVEVNLEERLAETQYGEQADLSTWPGR